MVCYLRIDGKHVETGSKTQILYSIKERYGKCSKIDDSNYVAPTGERIEIEAHSSQDFQ